MGFFPKNAGSRLFNAGFAISDEDSKLIDIVEELENHEAQGEGSEVDYSDIGCADVIHLLHSLPRKGNQTELHAIVKTFEVLGISLLSLLEEARRKKQLTNDRLVSLDQEIDRLNEELEQRREETNMLNLGLEELNKLEESLEKMVDLEAQDHQEQEEDNAAVDSDGARKSSAKTKSNASETVSRTAENSAVEEAEPVAMGDAYALHGEDLVETQKIIDLDRVPKSKSSVAEKLRAKSTRKRRSKSLKNSAEA